jgi:hypothetical protein
MAAGRKELNEEYEAQVGIKLKPSKDVTHAKNPARFGLDRCLSS